MTLMIKGQITLTFLEIFLNNTNTPSNLIQFHFYNLPNTQINFSHIGYIVFVFSFGKKLNEVFSRNGETITIVFTNKQNQTSTIKEETKREYRDGWTLWLTNEKEIIFDISDLLQLSLKIKPH